MNFDNAIVLSILGVSAVILVIWVVRRYFTTNARWERRRRRSNTRLSSTAKRPMVRFSVNIWKKRRK